MIKFKEDIAGLIIKENDKYPYLVSALCYKTTGVLSNKNMVIIKANFTMKWKKERLGIKQFVNVLFTNIDGKLHFTIFKKFESVNELNNHLVEPETVKNHLKDFYNAGFGSDIYETICFPSTEDIFFRDTWLESMEEMILSVLKEVTVSE